MLRCDSISLNIYIMDKCPAGWIIISILGSMAAAIMMMAIYVTVIEKKFRLKK